MIKLKQHELPINAPCILEDGTKAVFKRMNGMYAEWDIDGETKVGNYRYFVREKDVYKVTD